MAKPQAVVQLLLCLAAALLLLLLAAPAYADHSEDKDDKLVVQKDSDKPVAELDTSVDPFCPWGGYNVTNYPWAKPRYDLGDGKWYCNMTRDFRDQVKKGQESDGYEFVLYGDSLTQCLRNWGDNCAHAVDWFNGGWGKNYSSINWALGGDNPATLMWRLANGGAPIGLGTKLVFLMIGSNALKYGAKFDSLVNSTAEQVIGIADYLTRVDPDLHVLMMGLLPKTGYKDGGRSTGVQDDKTADANAKVNKRLEEWATDKDRVTYSYCGAPFLEDDGKTINRTLMQDGLHPNGKGWAMIGECVAPVVSKYLGKDTDEEEVEVKDVSHEDDQDDKEEDNEDQHDKEEDKDGKEEDKDGKEEDKDDKLEADAEGAMLVLG